MIDKTLLSPVTSTANPPQNPKQESSANPEIPDTEEKFHEIWQNKFVVPIPKEIMSQCQIKLCKICGVSPKSLVEARLHYLGTIQILRNQDFYF